MDEQQRPEVPVAGIVYGEIIYWGTLLGAVVSVVGLVMTFITKRTYLDPGYMLTAVWQGKGVTEIWEGAVGAIPNGHWYLSQLGTGNGIAELGMAIGVFSVTPAIFAAAVMLLKKKDTLYAGFAIVAGIITVISMVGVFAI